MTMSKVEDTRGDKQHDPNGLSNSPTVINTTMKNSNKPLTSFGIADILGVSSPQKPSQNQEKISNSPSDNFHDDSSHHPRKITRSTSPDLPEINQRSKDYNPKTIYSPNEDSDNALLTNGKRRMNNTLQIFNSLAKVPRNGKMAEDFRTATVAAAAAVASINPNNFFSSPFGCFSKTLLQGFIPTFNLNHNHLTPPPHPQHPHHMIPHPDSNHQHHHHHHPQQLHHQQQQQQHSPQSPSFLQGPVNLSFGSTNTNNNQTNPNSKLHNSVKIVRPWDDKSSCLDASSPSPSSKTPPNLSSFSSNSHTTTTTTTTTDGDDSYDDDDEDEEISVDDEDPPAPPQGKRVKAANGDGVSPLDALMAMTSKTFAGLDNTGTAESKRKDPVMFGKHQPPKKRRKSRTAFTNQQIYELEKRFLYQKYLTPADRDEIAISLGLTNAQVITWFQNRRAKLKRDLEELKNDVTASKKLPIPRNISGSVTEMELRRIQERTLRESFTNGGLQSPSSCSMASLSDDHDASTPIQDVSATPIRDTNTPAYSPQMTDLSDKIHVDVVSSDPTDMDYSSKHTGRLEGSSTIRNSSEDCDDHNDMNENSNASLSPRESRENGGIVASDCGSRCDVDNQKNIGCFPVEVV